MLKGAGVPDFVLLNEISENALVKNLTERFHHNDIYTYIGEVVVSVNPYTKLDHLYNKKTMDEYRGKYHYEKPPHIYSLSNNAYRRMLQNREDQCVIISGESGAGKTEASKIMMQYIAVVSKSSTDVDRVKNQLLESNPILEAFGNAKTLRNDNSSRFGKYMEIQFERDGSPKGGRITNYLLEKIRVVKRSTGERAFHIFYQILSGLSQQELGNLHLDRDPSKYHYLKHSECVKVDTINDVMDFKVVTKALDTLGFSAADKSSMWRIIAGILHLGNVNFQAQKTNQGQVKTVISDSRLASTIENVFQIPSNSLQKALTTRSITTGVGKRSSSITIPLDEAGALFTRDALAKGLYSYLFDWLVGHLNKSLACKNAEDKLVIGLLDIYGFEILENNSFEQFCINLCNEKLQQLFIELTLKSEQEEYIREGIKWEPVKYFNNKTILDLIEGGGKTISITSLMDECGWVADNTDMTLLSKMNDNFAKHPHYESYSTSKNKKIGDTHFILKHYAGEVTYNINEFLDKNKDTFFLDLIMTMQSSTDPLITSLFPSVDLNSKKRPLTAATQFKNALNLLMEKLLACQPHYIRCIKPNEQKKAGVLNEELARHQVRYLGLVENVRVRRAGFAFRQLYDRFVFRYKMLCSETWPSPGIKDFIGATKKILAAHNVSEANNDFRLGKTKVFIRHPNTLFALEEKREAKLPEVVTLMQAGWRGYFSRSRYNKVKAATKIQLHYRRFRFNRWFWDLEKTFKNVQSDPTFGKNVRWPQHPKILENASVLIRKIHVNWRAKMMVNQLSPSDQAEMRQKVLAYTIFAGKKPWNCSRRFLADYLDTEENPNRAKYASFVKNDFQKYGDTEIYFSEYIDKVNSKDGSDKRAVVVSEKTIYKHDPNNYKFKKLPTPLSAVQSINLSTKPDTFVVVTVQEPHRDLVFNLGVSGVEKVSEFVTVIVQNVKKLTGNTVPVNFNDSIKYNTGRSPKKPNGGQICVLTFQPTNDSKIQGSILKKGKGNNNVVYYKA